jgi:hypothetical protein
MTTTSITTLIKMMESLPETAQDQVVEHLRNYVEDMKDEMEWDELFINTQPQLSTAAKKARKEIADGLATPMDYDKL